MNWGHKISMVYVSFVAFMGFLVWMCVQQDDIHLVSKNYYSEEIAYEDNITRMKNTNHLSSQLKWEYQKDKQEVIVTFPTESIGATGKIRFYRPSDARKDLTIKLELNDTAKQNISVIGLDRGLWVLKVDWQKDGKSYYKEDKITL